MTPALPVDPSAPLLVLIAPNVSEQKGGEGIKALQIFQAMRRLWPHTLQITHVRNREELSQLGIEGIHYVEDDWRMRGLWQSRIGRPWVDQVFLKAAVALAERLIAERQGPGRTLAIIHQTEPNSPVKHRPLSQRHLNVFGPINGNIYYPEAFQEHESFTARWRRRMHGPMQRLRRLRGGGLTAADLILVAGGERTYQSLRLAGTPDQRMVEALDCGLPDDLFLRPRIHHAARNAHFVHFGRLVFHKGTALILEALAHSRERTTLDVIGRGPELDRCKRLATDLGLQDRVRFLDWYADRADLLDALKNYRGMVLPSLEDANGIVVQEVMALGLPPVCLDWGGPSLLIESGWDGWLVPATTRDAIIRGLAQAMDTLALDPSLAEVMSQRGREKAEAWRWSQVAQDWATHLLHLASRRARRTDPLQTPGPRP